MKRSQRKVDDLAASAHDEIEFGQLRQSEPQTHRRPDVNRQLTVVTFGNPREDDLPIFVDLDALRDMEQHARVNTSVELGGVMLGGQFLDSGGNPFVVVSDSLRAQHYEATRGSFKFTHETWQHISRQRQSFPDELQMVGWYHTHPDWGVFLSGMDTFICENFFSRPLDVALVIDPCRDQRGWFFWDRRRRGVLCRSNGFHLFTHRHRAGELHAFAAMMGGEVTFRFDPQSTLPSGGGEMQPVVHVNENRFSWHTVAIVGMLTAQFFLLALLTFKVMVPNAGQPLDADRPGAPSTPAAARDALHDAQLEVLRRIVEGQGGQRQWVDTIAELQSELARARSNLDAQMRKSDQLDVQLKQSQKEWKQDVERYERTIAGMRKDMTKESAGASGENPVDAFRSLGVIHWLTLLLVVVSVGLLGGLAGYAARSRLEPPEDDDEPPRGMAPSSAADRRDNDHVRPFNM